MNCFVGHNCANYQWVVMGVSSRDSLDTACISPISADLMLRRWAFRAELDSHSPGFLQGVAGAELSSDEVGVVAAESELGSEPDSEADF